MLVLIVGDTHFSGKNPVGRLDDIVDVQFDKLEEIVGLSKEYNAPIIHTGDIFNVAMISNRILTRIGTILYELDNPLYFVWGNHDLLYHTMELWDRTSLGVLLKNNHNVRHISDFFRDYKVKWAWYDWDDSVGICWPKLSVYSKPDFLLTHKAVVTERKMGKNSWVTKDEDFCMNIDNNLELEGYQLIICGHWHKPYMFKHKGTLVINPGPVLRRSIEEWLMPSVVLLNTDTLLHKRIYLKAKLPEQVLSKKHIEQKIESYTEGVTKFIEQLKHVKKTDKSQTFRKNLFELLDSHELPKNIENILRNIIVKLIEKGAINESV